MQNKPIENSTFGGRVVIFPAMTPEEISEGQIYFLFSIRQVEDIIKEASVHPVPFSPPYIEGITLWRDLALPVISLEKRLELAPSSFKLLSTRFITLRFPVSEKNKQFYSSIGKVPKAERMVLRVAPTIRMLSLPISSMPVPISSVKWIPRKELIRAVYEWEEGYLIALQSAIENWQK
jgi:chemotaxis signal transduction protein